MTTDGAQHYQAISVLEGEGIPFQEKTQAMGHNTRRAGTVGAAGERRRRQRGEGRKLTAVRRD